MKWICLPTEQPDRPEQTIARLLFADRPNRSQAECPFFTSGHRPFRAVIEPKLIDPAATGLARRILQFQQASESLERARRARVDRLILDWEKSSPSSLPLLPQRRTRLSTFVDWLLRRKSQRQGRGSDFDAFLMTAHRHEAVARNSTESSRRWFDEWRQYALAVLRFGLSARTLLTLHRSAAISKAARAAVKRPLRHADADSARLRERLENVIFPNAPGTAGSLRHLAAGDGLATTRI